MRARNFSDASIHAAIWQENLARCNPPLAEREVRTIARSSAKYPAGEVLETSTESIRPSDFTDTGNARLFARIYRGHALYTKTKAGLFGMASVGRKTT